MITTPTRSEFETFLGSQKLIRAFEELFNQSKENISTSEETQSDSKANQATSTGIGNEIRSKSNNILIWLNED